MNLIRACLRWSLLLVLMAAASVVCLAQDDEEEAEQEKSKQGKPRDRKVKKVTVEASLPYVPQSNTIATRLPVPPFWIPSNLGTVSEAVIKDQLDLVLGQALRNVSGVNAQTQNGVTDYFLIRGFDSLSSGMVLTDGAAEPEVTFFQMYNVERVEVFKGPAGFLYGRNALSGPMAGAGNEFGSLVI